MPKKFPESVKLEAMRLFVAGDKTAKEIAEIVESIVPNSKITFGENVSKDSRSYKVNFDKIENELDFKPKRKLDEGINEMYDKFIEISMNEKEFLDKKFYRLKYLKWLLNLVELWILKYHVWLLLEYWRWLLLLLYYFIHTSSGP